MTIEQLEKLKIIYIGSKVDPRKFHIPFVGDFKIPDDYSIQDIFELIYERGVKDGIEQGEKKKIDEIKKVLNIHKQEIPF